MQHRTRNVLFLSMGVVIGLSIGLARGVFADKPPQQGGDLPWQDARTLAEVMERVKHDYVTPVDDHQLLQAAVRGMVSSLDPYSAYLDGDEYEEIKISSAGEYSGVGIEVSMEDDQIVVVAPLEGSPAATAGIRSGDVIVSIDGVPVNSTTLADTIGRMRGKEGTIVKIGVLREGSNEPMQFAVTRRRVELRSVRSQLPEKGLGYVRIAQFSETTGDELDAAWKDLVKRNGGPLKGLVLDMRDNPGGVLEAAVAVADDFLDRGVIVTARGRIPEAQFEMDATPGDLLNNHRATLMGRTTFGKGSVQTVEALPGDTALKLTTSLYFTPSGISINHKGIAPDILLERDEKATAVPDRADPGAAPNDPELQRALQELKSLTAAGKPSLSAAVR